MPLSSLNAGAILPPEVSAAVWSMATDASVALQVTRVLQTNRNSVHFPIVTETPQAAWIDELQPITESAPSIDELIVTPRKLAALTRVSNETLNDSDPAALSVITQGIAIDLGNKLDQALFGVPAPAGAPAGLPSVAYTSVDAAGYVNLDPFLQAISEAASLGATLTAFVADPATALTVRSLKSATGSNSYLLDVSAEGAFIAGVPLFVDPAVEAGVVWGIAGGDNGRVVTVASALTELAISQDSAFNLYATDVRGVIRAAFGVTQEASVIRIADPVV